MEAPCRKRLALASRFCALWVLTLFALLLVASQGSAQSPFVVLPEDLQPQQIPTGTFFRIQLSANFAAAYTIASAIGIDKSSFELTPTSVLQSTRALTLNTPQIAVIITATDAGGTLRASRTYTIFVVANTQGIPLFYNLTRSDGYDASVPEDAVGGTEVTRVYAAVPGGGVPILSFLPPSLVFFIQGSRVLVGADGNLDRETTSFYNLTIQAKNGNESNYTQIFINVTDINDKDPTIESGQIGYLYATDPANTLAIMFNASDADIGINKELTYSIIAGIEKDHFRIDAATGYIYINVAAIQLPPSLNLTIQVVDGGSPSRSSTGVLDIEVLVANNSAPVFINSPYSLTINESAAVPSQIFLAEANDTDPNVAGQITFSLSAVPTVNGQPIFSINQDSGWISLIQPLDFELKVTYEFNITATDRHRRKPQAAMTYITISILDVNDNNPKFSQSSYMYDLSENTSVNHLIVDLSMFASDEDTLASGDLSFYFYPPIDNSFRLDSTNGELRLNQTLSRKTQPNHVLYIFAEDAGNPRLRGNTTIYIRVIEVNDYVPQINIPSQIDVFETNGTKVNQPFYFINVTDPDGGPSGNVTLSITSGDSTLFRVQPYQHGLYYTRALDYESVSVRSWTITITARDAGDPVFSTNKTLTINLQDWNEYAPVFSRDRYAGGVDLSTTTPTGTALVQVSATDADGLFNKVTYQITAGQNSTEFTINPATGLIANGAIGISQTQNFTLTVTATDNGIPFQRNASVEVEIRVLRSENVNDPVFAQEYFNVSIFENLPVGTQIAQVNASDKDQGEAGSVFYVQQSSLNDFYVDPGSGNVTTRRVFDFENGPRVFVIVVQARDRGAFRPRTSPIPASIEVHIINVNDRPPVFVLAPYTGSVAEDDAVNTTLSQKVLATDADGPQHPAGIVRYSIAPGGGSVDFRIDSVTGVLSIAMPLDHERQASYSLTIVATDGATVPMNATAQYTIQVTDVNDNTPVFYLPLVRSVAIDEEMPAGTFLTRVAANDSDSQLAGMVTYSIDPAWFSLFRVNASTGVLTTAVKLNRETSQGNYNVTVHATDGGSPARRASIVIAVTVNDINDMAPHFSSPFYTASTPEAVPNGQLVAMVSATDGDIDIAHRMVTYSIVGGTGQLLFAVNMVNGDITKVGRLDFETVKAYTLIVNATDGMFTDLTLVTILISDSNDNNPYFNQSLYRASVSENSPAGTFVVRVFVLDADTLQDDVGVSFSLVTPAVPFAVNTQSGVITANGSLDYDILPREYNITVACHPLTNLSVTYNTTVVWISLLPLNDNSPVFNPFRILVSVFENAPPGIIAVVDATDADVPAAQLTYSLATAFSNSLNDSEIRATFRVDSATGAVSTTKALDRERITAVVTLTITASDGANLGAAFLYVSVNDVIDTAPAFPRSVYSYTIIENTSPHLIIATLRAVDGDTNDRLTYAINDTAALPYFSIGQLDGQLRLIRTLNRENRDKWVFNVTATDLLNLVGVTTVDITVSDHNDQVPQFVGAGSYSVSVSEAASVGLNIGLQLRATDGDINSNAQFSFSTTGGAGSSDFSVNPVTGVMSIRQPLDRERQSFYSIQVTVTDLGTPPLNSSMNVNITIIDVNDEPPVMNRTTYSGCVCANGSTPVSTSTGECVCRNNTANVTCTTSATCPVVVCDAENTTDSMWGMFDWPAIIVNATTSIICPTSFGLGRLRYANRTCLQGNDTTVGFWDIPLVQGCDSSEQLEEDIQQLSMAVLNATTAVELVSAINSTAQRTDTSVKFTPAAIQTTALAILHTVNSINDSRLLADIPAQVVLQPIVQIVNRILDEPPQNIPPQSADIISQSLELLVTAISVDNGTSLISQCDNIGVIISCPSSNRNTSFRAADQDGRFTLNVTTLVTPALRSRESVAFDILESQTTAESSNTTRPSSACLYPQTSFILYTRGGFFVDANLQNVTKVASPVLSAQVTDGSPLPPERNVQMAFDLSERNLTMNDTVECVFWEYSNGTGVWSSRGCSVLDRSHPDRVVCQCDHLTNFAILVSRSAVEGNRTRQPGAKALSIVTYVGCGISMAALLSTIVTILMFKSLRNSHHQRLVLGLSVTLLLLLAIFISTIWAARNKQSCQAVAIVMHYLLLCAFLWMSAEASFLYKQTVTIFGGAAGQFIKKLVCAVFVIPLFIVGISAGATQLKAYSTNSYCWISDIRVFYGAFVAPMALTLIYNLAILTRVVLQLHKRNKVHANMQVNKQRGGPAFLLRFVVWLSVLLGVTWTVGLLVVIFDHIILHWLFTVLNVSQGALIFLFHTARPQDVRKEWREWLRRWRPKTADAGRKGKGTGAKAPSKKTGKKNKKKSGNAKPGVVGQAGSSTAVTVSGGAESSEPSTQDTLSTAITRETGFDLSNTRSLSTRRSVTTPWSSGMQNISAGQYDAGATSTEAETEFNDVSVDVDFTTLSETGLI